MISGVSFDVAWRGRLAATLGDVPVAIIGRAELIANKRRARVQRT
jgi:hypothetical protein